MFLRRRLLLVSSIVALSMGCDDGSSAPTLETNLPSGTQADDLSDDQARELCLAYQRLANEIHGPDSQKRVDCVLKGAVAEATHTTSCETTYKSCLKESTFTGQTVSLSCGSVTAANLAGCGATVEDITNCANGISSELTGLLDGFDCSVATDADARAAYLQSATVAASGDAVGRCEALAQNCRAVFEIPAN